MEVGLESIMKFMAKILLAFSCIGAVIIFYWFYSDYEMMLGLIASVGVLLLSLPLVLVLFGISYIIENSNKQTELLKNNNEILNNLKKEN